MNNVTRNKSAPLRLIIIGGGYAGLSALITFRKHAPDAEITLIDPRQHHLMVTRLHETVHSSLDKIQIPYTVLAKRFNFIHRRQSISFDEELLGIWDMEKFIRLGEESLPFDYLLIATGALVNQTINELGVYDLNAISYHGFAPVLEKFLVKTDGHQKSINIVGGGSTGIQFAFEIAYVLQACHADYHLNLIESGNEILTAFPAGIGRYVQQRMGEKRISIHISQYYKGTEWGEIVLENSRTGEKSVQPSNLTLLLIGKKPELLLHANSSGQILINGKALTSIFTAGDCSYYDEMGSNLMTAQSALRKGRAAAKSILLKVGIVRFCLPYMHQDIGYLLSLGPGDAVGWIGNKNIIISGLPAFLAKEAIEAQYNLLLSGIDSYFL